MMFGDSYWRWIEQHVCVNLFSILSTWCWCVSQTTDAFLVVQFQDRFKESYSIVIPLARQLIVHVEFICKIYSHENKQKNYAFA